MERKRILILDSGHVPSAGLFSMLSMNGELDVQAVAGGDGQTLLQTALEFKPQVLILDESNRVEALHVLARIFKDFPRLRTIIVNWDKNQIQVCDQQTVFIAGIVDFLQAL